MGFLFISKGMYCVFSFELSDQLGKSGFSPIGELSGVIPEEYRISLNKTLANCFGPVELGVYLPSTIYGIYSENRVVSTLFLTSNNYIYNLCTDPEYQGRGLMRQLLRYVIGEVSKTSFHPLSFYLEVDPQNLPAYSLYLKAGFEKLRTSREGQYDLLELKIR